MRLQRITFAAFLLVILAQLSPSSEHPQGPIIPADQPEPKKAKVDLYGDPLPHGALMRMGTTRLRHHDLILCLAVSPDFKMAASAGGDFNYNPNQTIRLWDLKTGRQIRELVGHWGIPGTVVFSPDGKTLASIAACDTEKRDGSVYLWDVASGKKLHALLGHCDADPEKGPNMTRYGLAFSPDGKVLASFGSDQNIRLWHVASGKELQRWSCRLATALAFSPDGKLLASGGEPAGTIELWNVATGKEIGKIREGHKNWLYSLFFPSNGKQIISSGGGVFWWDLENAKEVRTIRGDLLAWSRNGKFMTVRGAKDIQIWDLEHGKEINRFPTLGKFPFYPVHSCFSGGLSDDGSTLGAADWSVIRVLDTRTGKERHLYPAHWAPVLFVGFSPDDRRLISAGDRVVRTWDAHTSKNLSILQGHASFISSACLSPESQTFATAARDGTIRLWDLLKEKAKAPIWIDRGTSPLIAFSPDGKTLASKLRLGRGKETIQIWDIESTKELRRFGTGNAGDAIAFLPNGKGLLDYDRRITVLDAKDGKRLRDFQRMPFHNWLAGLVLSRDGRIAATGQKDAPDSNDPRNLSLWEMASATLIAQFPGHKAAIASLALSPDGKLLATGSWDATVRVWEFLSGRQLACFSGHRGGVLAVAFSHNGRRLASGGSDSTVLVWDVAALTSRPKKPSVLLAPEVTRRLWNQLLAHDAAVAYPALKKLLAAGDQTVLFLKAELPWENSTRKRVKELLSLLNNDTFAVRQKALRELEDILPVVQPILKREMAGPLPLETRQRLQKALAKPGLKGEAPEPGLRALRALQILEYLNTDQALRLIETLAQSDFQLTLRTEATASLERLKKRRKEVQ
jgi:WD40 repeat protein